MGMDLTVYVGNTMMEKTGVERLVIQATRKEIEEWLREFKGESVSLGERAFRCRHIALRLYDANAKERMGYDTWSALFMEFTGIVVPDNTFYCMVSWAEWESLLGINDTLARLTASEARTVAKYVKQYGVELVAEAHQRMEQIANDPDSRLSLDKLYETNLRKLITMRLHSLPTEDPRRALLEAKDDGKKGDGKKDEPAKGKTQETTTNATTTTQTGQNTATQIKTRTETETQEEEEEAEGVTCLLHGINYAVNDVCPKCEEEQEQHDAGKYEEEGDTDTEVSVEYDRRVIDVVPPGYARLCAIESAAVAFLAALDEANPKTIRLTMPCQSALKALRDAMEE